MNATRHRVILVGAHGYGASHLRNLQRLSDRVELVALVDPKGAPETEFTRDVPAFSDLRTALTAGATADVVIVATPTGTHHDLAIAALDSGCDLYLEKPPVASLAQFESLLERQSSTGRAVQVGFQSFGSHAIDALADLGRPLSVCTWGAWIRTREYWERSPWAGRRSMYGNAVVDGVLTNPLSHAIATALLLVGARRREDVARVEVELLRANDIEADDTSTARITLHDGRTVSAALTLCSDESVDPVVELRAERGDAELWYIQDAVRTSTDMTIRQHERDDLFENLLDHRENGAALISSLVDTGAYMEVLEAVRLHEPAPVPEWAITLVGEGPDSHAVVDDVADWCIRAARAGSLFSEIGAPWARPSSP